MTISQPEIRQAPLGPQTQPRMSRHDVICVHTMVGYLTSTDPYFRVSNGAGYDGTESHYGVGGKWGPDLGGGWDGRIWQWQDLAHTADANYQGNGRVISIETADNAPAKPEDIAAWTLAQLTALIDLIAWLCTPEAHAGCPSTWRCHQEGIPAELVPDTQSFRRGLAYHAQGAAEWSAGELWSTSRWKPCPAAARIRQFKTIVIPGVQARLAGQEVDPMADYAEQLDRIEAKLNGLGADLQRRVDWELKQLLPGVSARVDAVADLVRDLSGVTGDDEAKLLAELDLVRDEVLAAVTPDPTQPASASPGTAGAGSEA